MTTEEITQEEQAPVVDEVQPDVAPETALADDAPLVETPPVDLAQGVRDAWSDYTTNQGNIRVARTGHAESENAVSEARTELDSRLTASTSRKEDLEGSKTLGRSAAAALRTALDAWEASL